MRPPISEETARRHNPASEARNRARAFQMAIASHSPSGFASEAALKSRVTKISARAAHRPKAHTSQGGLLRPAAGDRGRANFRQAAAETKVKHASMAKTAVRLEASAATIRKYKIEATPGPNSAASAALTRRDPPTSARARNHPEARLNPSAAIHSIMAFSGGTAPRRCPDRPPGCIREPRPPPRNPGAWRNCPPPAPAGTRCEDRSAAAAPPRTAPPGTPARKQAGWDRGP